MPRTPFLPSCFTVPVAISKARHKFNSAGGFPWRKLPYELATVLFTLFRLHVFHGSLAGLFITHWHVLSFRCSMGSALKTGRVAAM